MASVEPTRAQLDRVIRDSNEESSIGTIFQHPRAPKTVSKELPDMDPSTQQHPETINYGTDQWIPPNLLFHNNIQLGIDSRLAYTNDTRAVAQPSFTCTSTTLTTTQWGAVGDPTVLLGDDRKQVFFEQAFDSATRPPLPRMVIHTDTENIILADSEPGMSSVTVVDVQRAVIRWMKDTRTSSGTNNLTRQFSKLVRMVDDDGTEAELEIWVWKGLRPMSTNMIHWHLHLCEP